MNPPSATLTSPKKLRDVVVVGAGVAGLSTALAAHDSMGDFAKITVLEADSAVGGLVRTTGHDGFVIEGGANGFLDNAPATLRLVQRLGLTDRLVQADATAAKRYLWVRGALHPLPGGPGAMLRSPLLSWSGRLRILREPFVGVGPDETVDETVGDFARRRLGPEATRTLVDPMVSGVFAGDLDQLSLRAAFPRLAAMERTHGSLIRAMVARQKAGSARGEAEAGAAKAFGGRLTSFVAGMQELIEALATSLEGHIQCDTTVTGLSPRHDGGWVVETTRGQHQADAVVLAVPASVATRLVSGVAPRIGTYEPATASVATVAVAYPTQAISAVLDGFGFLVPRGEGLRTLGCLWESSIFPGHRAPAGFHLLRVILGGAHDPEVLGLSDAELVSLVREELSQVLGITAAPERHWIARWPQGIAQFGLGHVARRDALRAALPRGLWLTGSAWDGVAVNSCIERSESVARELVASQESL